MFPRKHLWVLVVLLSIFSILPFFNQGTFPIHDDTQVARVYEMGQALKDGMFPVRWVSDLGYGYGYPIFNFYGPLAYYFGGLVNIIGLNPIIATKAMMVVGILLSGIFMYYLAREFWGEAGGIVSGLLYLYSSYHAVEIYVRGDVGEFFGYAFIPLLFYSFWKFFKEKKLKFLLIGTIAYFSIITSHNLTALMITPFIILFVLLNYLIFKKRSIFLSSLLILLFGIVISAFYWMPALLEMKYTNVLSQIGGGADFRDHFVCIKQLWNSPWGFGGSAPGCSDGLSLKLGKIHLILFLFSIFIAVYIFLKKKVKSTEYKEELLAASFSILGFLISAILMLDISKPIWNTVPFMDFIQYPWRFLIFSSFFASFLSGLIIYFLKNKFSSYLTAAIIIVLIIYSCLKIFIPQTYLYKPVSDFTDNYYLKWTVSRISDEYLPIDFSKPKNADNLPKSKISPEENLNVDYKVEKTQSVHALINVKKAGQYTLNIAYFPSWRLFVDGKEEQYKILKRGLSVNLPKGNHVLDVRFEQTPLEKISNLLSLCGIFVLIAGIIFYRRKRIL